MSAPAPARSTGTRGLKCPLQITNVHRMGRPAHDDTRNEAPIRGTVIAPELERRLVGRFR